MRNKINRHFLNYSESNSKDKDEIENRIREIEELPDCLDRITNLTALDIL